MSLFICYINLSLSALFWQNFIVAPRPQQFGNLGTVQINEPVPNTENVLSWHLFDSYCHWPLKLLILWRMSCKPKVRDVVPVYPTAYWLWENKQLEFTFKLKHGFRLKLRSALLVIVDFEQSLSCVSTIIDFGFADQDLGNCAFWLIVYWSMCYSKRSLFLPCGTFCCMKVVQLGVQRHHYVNQILIVSS